ncbi:MAG: transporter, partial [bacterium]
GWVLGAGPIIQYPSATDDALGSEKWGAGPSFIALQQKSGWTYGALANHVQSFAGNEDRDDVSATFLQPFLAKTTKTYTTVSLNTESIYDYENSQWTVPINLSLGQMIKVGKRPISLEFGYRRYAEAPEDGPEWGLRLFVKFLFPK